MNSTAKVRMNANIDKELYQEFQKHLEAKKLTVTKFLGKAISNFVKESRYEKDLADFNELAKEAATKELLAVDKECSSDGI